MATKDRCFSPGGKQSTLGNANSRSDDNHQNLNLNHNSVREEVIPVSSSSTSGGTNSRNNGSSIDHGCSRSGQNSNASSWNKSGLKRSTSFNQIDEEEKRFTKNKRNLNKSSSILSLHIAAYENSVEAEKQYEAESSDKKSGQLTLDKSWKNAKKFCAAPSQHRKVLEIPRQPEQQPLQPETRKFKASERLFNVNPKLNDSDASCIKSKPSINFCITKEDIDHPKFVVEDTGNIEIVIPTKSYGRNYKITQNFNGCDITMEFKDNYWIVTGKSRKSPKTLFTFTISKAGDVINVNKITALSNFETFKISAPKIVVNGLCSAGNILLDSASDIQCNAKLYADSVQMTAKGEIRVSPTAIIRCNNFEAKSDGPFWLDGKIASQSKINVSKNILKINIDSKFLHIAESGVIGCDAYVKGKVCSILEGKISCSLRNFGRITAADSLKLYIKQIESVQDNKDDTAHRAAEGCKKFQQIGALNQSNMVHHKNDASGSKYQKGGNASNSETAVKFSTDVQKWTRGTISANKTQIEIDGNCDDLAQIKGNYVILDIKGSAVCEAGSTFQSKFLDMNVAGSLTFAGDVCFNNGKIEVAGKMESLSSSNFGVDSTLVLNVGELFNAGYWKINRKLKLTVNKNCVFTEDSYFQVPILYGNVGGDTVISGSWILHSFHLKTLNLHTTKSSIIFFNEGLVDVDNTFCNESCWNVGKNLNVSTCWIEQSHEASITAKRGDVTINGICATKDAWNGAINASNLVIRSGSELKCNAKVETETCKIYLVKNEHCSNPKLIIENDFKIKNGPLCVYADSNLDAEQLEFPDSEGKIIPKSFGLIINGNVYAQALYAEKVAVELGPDAKLILESDKNVIKKVDLPFSVGYLHTQKGSQIIATSLEHVQQQFQISKKWIHEGSLTVTGPITNFVAGSIVNKGEIRRQNMNGLSEAFFKVNGFLYNYSNLSAESFYMKHCQLLENFGRIECSNEFQCVEFENIINHGLIQAKQGGIYVKNLFVNNSKLNFEEDLNLLTKFIQQAVEGCINVGGTALIQASNATEDGWNGAIKASNLVIRSCGELKCNAKVKTEKCEIYLVNNELCSNSQLIIEDDFKVQDGALHVFGDKNLSTEELTLPDPQGNIMPESFGLTINGNVYAQALYAEKVAAKIGSSGKLILESDKNVIKKVDLPFYVGYLHTQKGSQIIATSVEHVQQQFQISTKWIHEGALNVTSPTAKFIAGSIVNKGEIQRYAMSETPQQEISNGLSEVLFKVNGFFYNYSNLSADSIYMEGCQLLENFGEIKCSNELECVEFQNLINHKLIQAKQGGIYVKNLFVNNSELNFEENFKLLTKFIQQGDKGEIFVDGFAVIETSAATDIGWNGKVTAKKLSLRVIDKLKCNAHVGADVCKITLASENSQFHIANLFETENPLFVNGDNQLLNEELDLPEAQPHSIGLLISGKLHAKALYAEKVAVELAYKGKMVFESDKEFEGNQSLAVLVSGYLNTHPSSEIVATSTNVAPLQFIFGTKWIHQGTLKCSNSVCTARSIINKGHFLPINKNDNPLRVFETIKYFYNYSEVAGGSLLLKGTGIFKNFGKFKAFGGRIDAQFHDIINHGQISSDIITLKYLTTDNTTLGGIIDAADNLTIDAKSSKSFDFKCTSNDREEFMLPGFSFTVMTPSPQINVPVLRHSDGRNLTTFAVEKQFDIMKPTQFSNFVLQDLKSDSSKTVNFNVGKDGCFEAAIGILKLSCKEVLTKFDGGATFDALISSANIPKIYLNGDGKVIIGKGSMDKTELVLQNLSDFTVDCIEASTILIPSENEVNLKSLNEQAILLIHKSFTLNGLMNIHGNIALPKQKGTLGYINGNLKGATKNDEFAIELDKLVIKGKIEYMNKLKLKNEWLTFDGELEENKNVEINNWGMFSSGCIQNTDILDLFSYLVYCNTGKIEAKTTKIKSPFLFHVQTDGKIETTFGINPEIAESLLSLESVICAAGQSRMQAESIQNKSVLLFEFSTLTTSTTADSAQLAIWKQTVETLKTAISNSSEDFENAVHDIFKKYQDERPSDAFANKIFLSSLDKFYTEVFLLVKKLESEGIENFDASAFIKILEKVEHFQRNFNNFEAFCKNSESIATVMYKNFLSKAKNFVMHNILGFGKTPAIDPNKKGIQRVGTSVVGINDYTEASADGIYENFTDFGHRWGTLQSAGDIAIYSSEIYQSKHGKIITTLLGSIYMEGETGQVRNGDSGKKLMLDFKKDLDAKNVTSKCAKIIGHEFIKIFNGYFDEADIESGQDVELENITGKQVDVKAENNVKIDGFNNFDKLSIKSRLMNDIQKLVNGSRVFAIRDELDLEVSDERLVLENFHCKHNFSFKGKSVDIEKNVSSEKSLNIDTTEYITFHPNSSVKTEENQHYRTDGPLTMTGADAEAKGNILCESKEDMKILTHKNGNSLKQCTLAARNTHMKSKKNMLYEAPKINSQSNTILEAEGNISIMPAEIKRDEYSSSSGFKNVTTEKSRTDVIPAEFSSGENFLIKSHNDSIDLQTTHVTSPNIDMEAKENLNIQDRVTEEVTTTTTSYFGFMNVFVESEVNKKQVSHPSKMYGNINLKAGNLLNIIGTQLNSGKIEFHARNVNVTKRVLNNETHKDEFKLKFLGAEYSKEDRYFQTGAENFINADSLKIFADNANIEGVPIEVAKDMLLEVDNLNIKGIKYDESHYKETYGVSVSPFDVSVSLEYENYKKIASKYENVCINVLGSTTIISKNTKFEDANLSSNDIFGNIDYCEQISNLSTTEENKTKIKIDLSYNPGAPIPINPGISGEYQRFNEAKVLKQTGIHSRQSISNEFKVKRLKLKGGNNTSDRDIQKFYETCEAEDVKEFSNFNSIAGSINLKFSKSKLDNISAGFKTKNSASESKLRSTIASTTNASVVAENNINSNIENTRVVTKKVDDTFDLQLDIGPKALNVKGNYNGYGASLGCDIKKKNGRYDINPTSIGVNADKFAVNGTFEKRKFTGVGYTYAGYGRNLSLKKDDNDKFPIYGEGVVLQNFEVGLSSTETFVKYNGENGENDLCQKDQEDGVGSKILELVGNVSAHISHNKKDGITGGSIKSKRTKVTFDKKKKKKFGLEIE